MGDLPLDVALWADTARSRLACRDGRARCTFSARDCESITDGSARYEEHGGEGEHGGFCRALFGPPTYDPRSCTSGYAIYVDDKCEVFNRDTASWQKQARSVGYSNQGWTEGRFSDGRTIPSTHSGRENNGPAVTCEFFEKPCKYPSPDPECIANGHTTLGNQGFAMDCDAVDGLVDVAVMEITACPAGNGSLSPEPAPAPAPGPVTCTAEDKDPYMTGSEVQCCDGLERHLGDWSGDGTWHYECKSSSPEPAPASGPVTTTEASGLCTAEDEDPYRTGSEVQCCDGLEKCLRDWSGDGSWHYKCKSSCASPVQSELVVVPGSSADLSQVYEQCGGKNWKGPTRCADGSTCTEYNKLYSQCVTREDLSISFLSRKRLRSAAIKVHRHSA